MDAIESMDWGAYSHFRFMGQQTPGILPWMHDLYHLGSCFSIAFLLLIALLLLLGQQRRRAALIALASFAAALVLIASVRALVPRRRPSDAQNILGPGGMLDSYPSAGVLLFMLTMILLGFALWGVLRGAWLRGAYVLAAGVLTVGVCLSQFFLCVHFVTDVIGAFVGAALIGWIACRLMAEAAFGPKLDWSEYSKFTDRARGSMQRACEEAWRLNHEYLGTEHLLLGLIKEGTGVAAFVLRDLGINLRQARLEVQRLAPPGPDLVTMGKLPQTPGAKKVLEFAVEESRQLNRTYIGTEHLLLGLVRDEQSVAAQILINLGLKLEDVRNSVYSLLLPAMTARDQQMPPHGGEVGQ